MHPPCMVSFFTSHAPEMPCLLSRHLCSGSSVPRVMGFWRWDTEKETQPCLPVRQAPWLTAKQVWSSPDRERVGELKEMSVYFVCVSAPLSWVCLRLRWKMQRPKCSSIDSVLSVSSYPDDLIFSDFSFWGWTMVTFEILEEWTKRRETFVPGLKGLNTSERRWHPGRKKNALNQYTTLGKFSKLHSFLSLQNYHLPGQR